MDSRGGAHRSNKVGRYWQRLVDLIDRGKASCATAVREKLSLSRGTHIELMYELDSSRNAVHDVVLLVLQCTLSNCIRGHAMFQVGDGRLHAIYEIGSNQHDLLCAEIYPNWVHLEIQSHRRLLVNARRSTGLQSYRNLRGDVAAEAEQKKRDPVAPSALWQRPKWSSSLPHRVGLGCV